MMESKNFSQRFKNPWGTSHICTGQKIPGIFQEYSMKYFEKISNSSSLFQKSLPKILKNCKVYQNSEFFRNIPWNIPWNILIETRCERCLNGLRKWRKNMRKWFLLVSTFVNRWRSSYHMWYIFAPWTEEKYYKKYINANKMHMATLY